ncbi:MAG: flavodoxin family protein [Desulfovibrio sp.]|nr:flavodoxin family protein [Desulfovibrio sp.]
MNRRQFVAASLAATAAVGLAPVLGGTSTAEAKRTHMNILVLTGSPRKNGNSATLAAWFTKGAEEAGHSVRRFDAAFKDVHPCTACNSCGMDGPCVFQDDFQFVREHIIAAEGVVFATPLYYFGFSSQLKAVIDRFYAINGKIHRAKKAVLLMTYADNAARKEQPLVTHYEMLLEYLGWTDAGRVIAPGVWPAGAINSTSYPQQAYTLGKSL